MEIAEIGVGLKVWKSQSDPGFRRDASSRRSSLLLLAACFIGSNAAADSPLIAAAKTADSAAALAVLAREVGDVNAAEADGTTALHWAIHHGDVELVDRLIAAGANVNLANEYGATPMSEAAVLGDAAVIEKLLQAGGDVDSPNADGQTALMVVARTSNVDAARLLLERGAKVNAVETRKGQTALMWATAQSRPEMMDLLIEHGADINAHSKRNEWERLVTAEPRQKNLPSGGFTPLLYAARQGCLACARLLLDAGAAIDSPDPDGVTPLLLANLNAHFETAKFLVERGANVSKWDWWGRSPLYSAVDYNTLPHGGRPDRLSLDDTTPLAMIEILLDKGANPNMQLKLFPPYRSLRMDRGADSILDIGTTPLLRAARAADLDAMRLLLERGALVDLPQVAGITPLMAAVGMGASSIDTRGRFRTESQALEAAAVLIEAGANVNARDQRGRTALHAAAAVGFADVAIYLATNGADLAAVDADGVGVVDAALGQLRGRGRGPAEAHEATAQALRDLIAAP
jgi:ankyrin repeat protein